MKYLFYACFSFFAFPALAQNTLVDSMPTSLKAVEIAATRLSTTDIKTPMAVTILNRQRLQTGTQQLSPYEVLSSIPGVFAMNPDNFSQDLRIAIRGFGARSAFGIRGIRMFVDGLPEGTPDGQVDVDNLDMGTIRQMEVIRGPASGIYGNASGGVIYMLTENPVTRKPLLEAQIGAGSYGFSRFQVKTGQNFGKWLYFFNVSTQQTDGYRDWSRMQNTLLNGKVAWQISPSTKLTVLGNYGNSPTARDPGALTEAQALENPRQAGANNLLFATGEAVTQGRIGAVLESNIGKKSQIGARLFYTGRHLVNRLAIASNGFGDLQRGYSGGGVSWQWHTAFSGVEYRLKAGLDIDFQNDIRQRFAYKKITTGDKIEYVQDTVVLHQKETFQSTGLYLVQEFQIKKRWLISLGGRYDHLELAAADRYLTNGDQSGGNTFDQVNPMAGISYSVLENASVYTNFATSFETPTLNELGNNPEGTGGFNPGLLPQRAQSFEAGAKGYFLKNTRFDLAAFHILTTNDIVPYQIAGQTGKTFYRNAGKTVRNGIELGVSQVITPSFTVHYTQTFSKFHYQTYTANGTIYDDKTMPGIPVTHAQLELRYTPQQHWFAIVQGRYVSKVFANDANTADANAYSLLNLRVGYVFVFHSHQIEPFAAVNNLTGSRYMGNVQINAQSDRYFEPAALQYFYGGVKFRL